MTNTNYVQIKKGSYLPREYSEQIYRNATEKGYLDKSKRDEIFARAIKRKVVKITEAGYALLAYSSTSNVDTKVVIDEPVVTVSDMIECIKSTFGLNPAQLATILGVSRATIYNHMSNKNSNVMVYADLYHISKKINHEFGSVGNGLKSISVDGKSLLKHLESSYTDSGKIFKVAQTVASRIKPNKPKKSMPAMDEKKLAISSVVYRG